MPSSRAILALTRIDRGTPAQLLVVLYIVLSIANMLVRSSVPIRLMVVVGVILLAYEAIGFRDFRHEQRFLYVLALWIVAALTLNGIVFGEWVRESIYVPGNIGVALALCRGHLGRRATLVLLYGAAVYFGYRLLSAPTPVAIHRILVAGSANGISGLMVVLCGLHYAVVRAEDSRVTLMPAVVALLVSALTLGRSGMAAAALLLAGVATRDLVLERRGRLLAAKVAVYTALVVAIVIVVLPRLELISFVFERFSEFGLGSEGRERIWAAYGESLRETAALVGHRREAVFGGFTNVHSSYILWHKSMGVMAIPLYLLAALAVGRALIRDWLLFVILASLLLRAAFDMLILPFWPWDFLFYYLVCTALVTLPSRRRAVALPRTAEA